MEKFFAAWGWVVICIFIMMHWSLRYFMILLIFSVFFKTSNESKSKKSDWNALQKMEKNGDGMISIDDLKSDYNFKYDPKYMSGEESEESIMNKFLANFEQGSSKNGCVSVI